MSKENKASFASFFKMLKVNKQARIIFISVLALIVIAGIVTPIVLHRQNQAGNAGKQGTIEQAGSESEAVKRETFCEGVIVSGQDLGGKTLEEAKKLLTELAPSLCEEIDIKLVLEKEERHLSADDFEYEYDIDEILDKAFATEPEETSGEKGGPSESQAEPPKAKPISFEITPTVKEDSIRAAAKKIAESITIEAKDAEVLAFNPQAAQKFTYSEGSLGLEVEEKKLYEELRSLLSKKKKGTIQIPSRVTEHAVTVDDLKKRTRLLSSFSSVSINTLDANHNMALALSSANGQTILPGQVFSFNGSTGDSTTGRLGYRLAGVISGGRLVQNYGGGICQAASTIYGAALRSGMTIVERYNHLWAPGYVPDGQDATVSYGSLDFKFRNDLEYPVYISAYMVGTKLICEIYGCHPDEYDEIKVNSRITQVIPAPETRYINDKSLAPGQSEIYVQSRKGYKTTGERYFYKNGALIRTEPIRTSYYHEVQGVVKVGPTPASSSETPSSKPSSEPPASSENPSSENPSSENPSSNPSSEAPSPEEGTTPETAPEP